MTRRWAWLAREPKRVAFLAVAGLNLAALLADANMAKYGEMVISACCVVVAAVLARLERTGWSR